MATDATGTPTSLGIPKFNVDVDAPSGLGFNAAMDEIDTLLAERPTTPTGIAAGEAMVWDGTMWVRSSALQIAPSGLGTGTRDGTRFLRDDGTWQNISVVTPGTQLDIGQLTAASSGFSATTEAAAATVLGTGLKGTFTVTVASPAVFTLAAHGLAVNDQIQFQTTGALPTGLTAGTTYFVSAVVDANTFRVSATQGGADVNTSGAQSGTHTAYKLSVTYDGSKVRVEVFAPEWTITTGSNALFVAVYRDATALGRIFDALDTSVAHNSPVVGEVFDTPGAGTHAYYAKAWLSGGAPATIVGGAGGTGSYVPAFIRVVKA